MSVIPFRREQTTSDPEKPCPGFCQQPVGHPFITDERESSVPFRQHDASFGGASAVRVEFLDVDEDGATISSWDGQPDLPDCYHEATNTTPWMLGDAQQVARDMALLSAHIEKHLEHGGEASV